MNLEKWAALVTIIGFPLLFISLFLAYRLDDKVASQLETIEQVARSQNNIALNTMFFNDATNIGIIHAIETKIPVLAENGGQFTDTQLDKYLGDFDTINSARTENLLTEDELCGSFSAYVQETASSTEIEKYVNLPQNKDYFAGLPILLKIVNESKNPICH